MIATLRCLRPFARQHRRTLVLGGLLAVVEVLVTLAQPWPVSLLIGQVLTNSGPRPSMSPTWAVAAAVGSLLVIYILAAIVDYWSTRLLSSAGLRLAADVRVEVYTHLQRQSLAFHANRRVDA